MIHAAKPDDAPFGRLNARFFLLAFFLISAPTFASAQSDSILPSSPLPSRIERSWSFLDSSETIWRDLLASLLQDSVLLSDSARDSFRAVACALDSNFNARLLRLRRARDDDSTSWLSERTNREQARREQSHLADAMLALYDSLSRAFDALLPPKRVAPTIDYKDILNNLLEPRESAHHVQFSVAYQSRSVWRGIEQNSGRGTYLFSGLYQHRSGFFFSGSALGLQGQSTVIDQASISVGIDYQAFERFLLSLAYARHFYSESSVQARAFINSDLTFWLSFQTELLAPSATLLWAFSDEGNKFFFSWEISRAFLLSAFSSRKLVLVPSVSGEYGSISTVLVQRSSRSRFNPEQPTRIQRASPFVLTNYLFSLSLLWSVGNFSFAPEFVLVVPVNLPSLSFETTGRGTLAQPVARVVKPSDKSFGYLSLQVSCSL